MQRYLDGLTYVPVSSSCPLRSSPPRDRATALTETHLCQHARSAMEKISPDRDTSLLAVRIPRLLITAAPRPQYYHNYHVGECRDLIFGVSLVDYATAKGLADGEIPKIMRICIDEIEKRGLDAEGIYRVSKRNHSLINQSCIEILNP